MTSSRRILIGVAACGLACATAVAAPAARVPLEFRHDPKAASRPLEAPVPPAPDLPQELAPPAPAPAPRTEAARHAVPRGAGPDVDGLAERAAGEMAAEAVHVWGHRQYWRAGFARGVAAAFEDPRIGRFEREDGYRYGSLDPAARLHGAALAADAAQADAARAAEDRAASQFTDLSQVPRFDPRPVAAPFAPAGPWAEPPALDDVFAAMPWSSSPILSRDARDALIGWGVAPVALARSGHDVRAYDAGWSDPVAAFSTWRDRQRPGSYWSRFGPADRDEFRKVFLERFAREAAAADPRSMTDGFKIGWADGWRYGAATRAEWEYRRGYADGFDAAIAHTAAAAYPLAFESAYGPAYEAAFHDWSGRPHPGIAAVRLEDGDGDGIFEPGERVLVDAQPANFGGGAGSFELRAEGGDLVDAAAAEVAFSGRGRVALPRPLVVRLAPDTPVRTTTTVTVTLGGARTDVPLRVSRPIEIDGPAEIDADRLAGRVRVTVRVANRSRRGVAATARIAPESVPGAPQDQGLGTIPAGGSAEAAFAFDGLDPLDLIDGTARWRIAAGRGRDDDDDALEASIASVVADPADTTLLSYMLGLAERQHPPRAGVDRARALMLERLRADWGRACAADGNPFKRDYEAGGAETALGALVQGVTRSKRAIASREVFGGFGDDVAALADALPGAHPLLRKWMKKLAQRAG